MLDRLAAYRPQALSLLRITAGFCFSLHGVQKLFGWLGGVGGRGTPASGLFLQTAGALEAFGGLLIILGLFTRPVAFVLAGQMAVAYFYAHAPRGFWPIRNTGELAALYAFVYLYLVTAGGGAWSLDRVLFGKSR